jgi:hypothetical protein
MKIHFEPLDQTTSADSRERSSPIHGTDSALHHFFIIVTGHFDGGGSTNGNEPVAPMKTRATGSLLFSTRLEWLTSAI